MTRHTVRDLVVAGTLRVEDGNHGNDRPRPDDFIDSGVAYIRAADMTSGIVDFHGAGKISDSARRRIRKGIGEPGDAILSHKGTVGRVAIARIDSPEYVCSPQTTFWRSMNPDILNQRYLAFVLKSPAFQKQLQTLAGETDMAPYVSLTNQRSMSIEVPSINHQTAIAEVLGAIDDKIAANKCIIELISELDLLEALRASRSPVAHVRLDAIATVSKGVSYRSVDLVESPNALVTLKSIDRRGAFNFGGFKPYAGDYKPTQILAEGDIIVPQTDLTQKAEVVGRAARVPRIERFDNLIASLDLAVVRSNKQVPQQYLLGILRQDAFREHCLTRTSGTTVLHLGRGAIESYQCPLASGEAMAAYAANSAERVQFADSLASANACVAATRDELLPLLMSGKIYVHDAERQAEDVL